MFANIKDFERVNIKCINSLPKDESKAKKSVLKKTG